MKKSYANKPLPKPLSTPFGRKHAPEQGGDQEALLADRMAVAAAEGRLDEFLKKEMPDNEHARTLANMMMGMTGMMPEIGTPASEPISSEQTPSSTGPAETAPIAAEVPEEVRAAIQAGDVQGLMGLLRKEHQKRSPGAVQEQAVLEQSPAAQGMPTIDKELIDALVTIAKDNSVTLDWIILRAIKVYVQEFQKTGKL